MKPVESLHKTAGADADDADVLRLFSGALGRDAQARIQPAATVYRGMHGRRLPPAMTQTNAHGVRGGVECVLQ